MKSSEWKSYKLSETVTLIGGGTPIRKNEEYWNGKIPWLSVRDFNNDYRLVFDSEEYITELGLSKSSAKMLNEGDLIISARGTVGEVAQLARPMAFNQSCYGLKANEELTTNDFLYYWLKYNVKYVQLNTHGSVFNTITKRTFDNLTINLPPIAQQRETSKILTDIDDKIQLNNQIISNLEELAQTLFKRWFIDFEFPNDDGEPNRSSGGTMVESELGLIPEGWEVLTLEDTSKFPIVCGKTPSTKVKENYGNEMPFITIPDMHNNVFVNTTEKYLSKTGIESQPKKTLPPLSICVSCIATPGLVTLTSERSQTNQQINNLIPSKIDAFYMYLYLSRKSQLIRELGSGGSTTLNLNKTQFSKIPVLYPNQFVREKFHKQVSPVFNEINNLQKQSLKLAQLRDTLLPKLLSGEIKLNEEKEVNDDVVVQ